MLGLGAAVRAPAQSNEGTDFWMAFMEHRDIGLNSMVVMITSRYNTSGVVSMPLIGWQQPFTVAANTVRIVSVPRAAETLGSEAVTGTGIHVTSARPVSVYTHQYYERRSEAATILPVESTGSAYYVMAYTGMNRDGESYPSEFIVVAQRNGTRIDIRPAAATRSGRSAGSTFTVTLDAGQTYQVQAAGDADLTGSYLSGNQPFTLLSGARWTDIPKNCGTWDNLLEMMYPIDTWGRRFVSMPNAGVRYDVFRILAAEDDTEVNVSGGAGATYTLDAGEFVEYQLSSASYISANRPIMVAQFNIGSQCSGHSVGDPSMVLLNSIEQTRDTVTLYNSSLERIDENYINIVGRYEDYNFITFDGQALPTLIANPGRVGPDGAYFYLSLPVQTGAHTIASAACGITATAYGYGQAESYAYGGGASFRRINANPIVEGGCLEDAVEFSTGLSPPRYVAQWTLHDGTQTSEHDFTHQYTVSGAFSVQLILQDQCLNLRDTFQRTITISPRQAVVTDPFHEACAGESIQLSAGGISGTVRYEWSGPAGFLSTGASPRLNDLGPAQSGNYQVIGIVAGCATLPAFTEIVVHPLPEPSLGADTFLCTFYGEQLLLDPGLFPVYRWQGGQSTSQLLVQQAGNYGVTVTDEHDCQGEAAITVDNFCPTRYYAPNAFSPNQDGVNDAFRLYIYDATAVHLRIYDRWGELLFETTGPNAEWSGAFRGRPLLAGLYIWHLDLSGYGTDGAAFRESRVGEVYLVR